LRKDWESERQIWLRLHPVPWSLEVEAEYHTRFSGAMERWLDAGHGSCALRQADCGGVVAESLRHFDGERFALSAFAVMPNHVHVLFVPAPEYTLEQIVKSWKTFSARKINSILQRSGALWQRDYFDRLIRDAKHFGNCVRYIRRNPVKANVEPAEGLIYESELARAIE
jgi:REP element-mobilizing transposase RayT